MRIKGTKSRDMFVCILYCAFNGMNGTEGLICARAIIPDNSNKFHRQIVFYSTHTNKMNRLICYSPRDVSFVTGMSVTRNVKKNLTLQ